MSEIAKTAQTPYYAVIFTSERTDGDNRYAELADAYLHARAVCRQVLLKRSAMR